MPSMEGAPKVNNEQDINQEQVVPENEASPEVVESPDTNTTQPEEAVEQPKPEDTEQVKQEAKADEQATPEAEDSKKLELTLEQKLAFAYRDMRDSRKNYRREVGRLINAYAEYQATEKHKIGTEEWKELVESIANDPKTKAAAEDQASKTSLGMDYKLAQDIFHEQATGLTATNREYIKAEGQIRQLEEDMNAAMARLAKDNSLSREEKNKQILAIKEQINRLQKRQEGMVNATEKNAKDIYAEHQSELDKIDIETDNYARPKSSSSERAGNYRGVGSWKDLELDTTASVDPEAPPETSDSPESPEEDQNRNLNMTAVHTDLSVDAERHAHYLAQKRWEDEMHNSGKNFFKRMGKKMMADYKKNKYYREFYEEIKKRQTLNLEFSDGQITTNTEAKGQFEHDIVSKYLDAYEDEIESSSKDGEYRAVVDHESEPYKMAHDIISQFVSSKGTNDERFEAFKVKLPELQEAINKYYTENGRESATGFLSIDNLLDIANNADIMVKNGEDMANVMAKFELVLGENRSTARTVEHYNAIDKATHKWTELKQRVPGLRVIPDELIAGAASIGIWAGTSSLNAVGRSFGLFGGAAVIGATSGIKESYKIVREKGLYDIDTAYGQEYGSQNMRERGNKFDKFQVERISSGELTDGLVEATAEINRLFGTGGLTGDKLNGYIDLLARGIAEKQFSLEEGVDRVTYSSADLSVVTQERRALAIAQSEARATIQSILENSDSSGLYGLEGNGMAQLNSAISTYKESFTENLTAQNRAFKNYKRLESLKTGAKAAGTSLLIGVSLQEAMAYVNPNVTGFFEGKTGSISGWEDNMDATNTVLRDIFGGPEARIRIETLMPGETTITSEPGAELTEAQQQQLAELREQGFEITDTSYSTSSTSTETVSQSFQEWQTNNPNEFELLQTRYFANDTAAIDLNERIGQLEQLSNGNIRFSADGMTAGGSFIGAESIDMTQVNDIVFTLELKGADGLESGIQKVFRWGEEIGPPWNELLYEKSPGVWNVKGDAIGHLGILDGAGGINVASSIPGDGAEVFIDSVTSTTNIENILRFDISDKRIEVPVEVKWPFAFGWGRGRELGSSLQSQAEQGPSEEPSSTEQTPASSPTAETGQTQEQQPSTPEPGASPDAEPPTQEPAQGGETVGNEDQGSNQENSEQPETQSPELSQEQEREQIVNSLAGQIDDYLTEEYRDTNKRNDPNSVINRIINTNYFTPNTQAGRMWQYLTASDGSYDIGLTNFGRQRIGELLDKGVTDFSNDKNLEMLFGVGQNEETETPQSEAPEETTTAETEPETSTPEQTEQEQVQRAVNRVNEYLTEDNKGVLNPRTIHGMITTEPYLSDPRVRGMWEYTEGADGTQGIKLTENGENRVRELIRQGESNPDIANLTGEQFIGRVFSLRPPIRAR